MDTIEIFFGKVDNKHGQTKSNYVKAKMKGLYGQLTLWSKIPFLLLKKPKKQALFYKRKKMEGEFISISLME